MGTPPGFLLNGRQTRERQPTLKFGIAVTTSVTPATTAIAQAAYVTAMTDEIERLGFDSLWVSDRTVYPNDLVDRYPDMYGPGLADPDAQNVLEALTTLSYAAGRTSRADSGRVRLGVSVLVLPFRNAVLNTKMLELARLARDLAFFYRLKYFRFFFQLTTDSTGTWRTELLRNTL